MGGLWSGVSVVFFVCMKFDVVIVGGGFVGVYCVKVLGKVFGVVGLKCVVLIVECNVFVF